MRKDTGFRLTDWERGEALANRPDSFYSSVRSERALSAENWDSSFSASIPAVTPELTYVYDGTFEGWLCCICESYESKEIPGRVLAETDNDIITEESLFNTKRIRTSQENAYRVRNGIAKRIGRVFLHLLERSFCTCLPDKEEMMLLFTRKGFRYGMRILNLKQDPVVCSIHKGLRELGREIHKWLGFVRFSDMQGILLSVIGAKNNVLPFIASHFVDRFRNEHFMIFDENHNMALVYRPGQCAVIPMERFIMGEPGEEEKLYRKLWNNYYKAIEIKPRHNETCRRTLMPKRYWDYLTEMAAEKETGKLISEAVVVTVK